MKTKHKPKKYPMDGIPLRIQQLRLMPRNKRETLEIRQWVNDYRKRGDHRPETVAAYTI